MLTAPATLAFFVMLGLSSFAVFWAKRVRMPHTVFLVVVGIVLGILAQSSVFTFFTEFKLTPELLFYLLLPTLIFESAFNINARRMIEDIIPIGLLSIVSLLMSAGLISVALYYLLPLLGLYIPFIVALLFGALISATDPVAVLALFKEFGAPRRLSLIFEGESLFNDATAVALFLVILDIVIFGFAGSETVIEGIVAFTSMLIGGVLFGLIMGGLFAKMIGATRESEIASITLTIVLAHTTFILAEILSHHLVIGHFELPLSPIIATTIASLVMGNYGSPKINPRAEEFVEKLWSQLAFMANSLVFILIGILITEAPIFNPTMLVTIVLTIFIVAIARTLSIYPVVRAYNRFASAERSIPTAWQHLLSWGSLRGALAITMVLLIPPTLTVPGWDLPLTVQQFLLAITIGCIFATLFVKATTIGTFMKKLKLDTMTEIERVEYQEAKALVHHEVYDRLERYAERGYISSNIAGTLQKEHDKSFEEACNLISKLSNDTKKKLAHRVLRIFAIGIENRHLKELYDYGEVNEAVFRRLRGKLQLQLEAVEKGNLDPNMSLHTDGKDIFEHMAKWLRDRLSPPSAFETAMNSYMYYRAQVIISRKVLKELSAVDFEYARSIFTPEALSHVTNLYETFKRQSGEKMNKVMSENESLLAPLSASLAQCGINKIEEHILDELYERQLITPKLLIALRNELLEKSL